MSLVASTKLSLVWNFKEWKYTNTGMAPAGVLEESTSIFANVSVHDHLMECRMQLSLVLPVMLTEVGPLFCTLVHTFSVRHLDDDATSFGEAVDMSVALLPLSATLIGLLSVILPDTANTLRAARKALQVLHKHFHEALFHLQKVENDENEVWH